MVLANDFGDSLATSLATSLAYEPVVPPTVEAYGMKMYIDTEMYIIGYASPGISKSPYSPQIYTNSYKVDLYIAAKMLMYLNGDISSATELVTSDGTVHPLTSEFITKVTSSEINRAFTIKVDHEGSEKYLYYTDATTVGMYEFYSDSEGPTGYIVGPDQSMTQTRSLSVGDTVYLYNESEETFTTYGTVTDVNVEIGSTKKEWITVSGYDSKMIYQGEYDEDIHPHLWMTVDEEEFYTSERNPSIGDTVYDWIDESAQILGTVASIEYDFVIHGLELEESEEDYFSNIVAFPGVSAIFDEDGNPVKQSVMVHVDGTYGNGNPFVVNSVMQWNSEYHEFDGPNPIPSSTQPSQIYYGLGNVYFTLLKG